MNLIKLLISAAVLVCGLAIAVAQVSPSAQVNKPIVSPLTKMNKSADCDPPLAQVYRPTECDSPVAHATK
jgi:hypothetical protein